MLVHRGSVFTALGKRVLRVLQQRRAAATLSNARQQRLLQTCWVALDASSYWI